jgi:hypothetical protein
VITTNEETEATSVVVKTNTAPLKRTAKITANIFTNPDSTFPITIKPSKINFPETEEVKATEYSFSLTNRSRQVLRPTLVSSPLALVTIVLPKTIPAGGSANGSIKIKDASLKKHFEKSFTFQLDDPNHTRFTIPIVRGFVPQVKPAAKGQSGH